VFGLLGGSGTCTVTVNRSSCTWGAASQQSWITVQNDSGSGSGQISFTVAGLALGSRSGSIRLFEGSSPSCNIQQGGLRPEGQPSGQAATLSSTLDLEGGEGQIVVDGSTAVFQRRGAREAVLAEGRALHRIEATVVNAEGRAGTWRFQVDGGVAPGTLRIVAGNGALAGEATLVFHLSGKPGERIVFAFRVN